jgi:hypothetical protein
MIATADRHGVVHYRWVSRGGVQIVGHVYRAHAERAVEAWRARQAERNAEAEVSVLPQSKAPLLLKRARA